MRVIVTRPPAQAATWVAQLRQQGVDAVALPLIDIAPASDPAAVQAAWRGLPAQALVMFVSANAVAHFFAQRPAGLDWPAGLRAGSTGPGTTAALLEAGLPPGQIVAPAADSPRFDSEALWALLAGESWAGRHVLVVRGEDGRDWFAQTLRAQGAVVDFVAAYRRLPPQPGEAERRRIADALAAPAAHLWLFSSSEAVARLQALAPGADWSAAQALASHPRIAASVRGAGFGRVDEAPPTVEAVLQRLQAPPSIQSAAP